jgi:hypothetical protein
MPCLAAVRIILREAPLRQLCPPGPNSTSVCASNQLRLLSNDRAASDLRCAEPEHFLYNWHNLVDRFPFTYIEPLDIIAHWRPILFAQIPMMARLQSLAGTQAGARNCKQFSRILWKGIAAKEVHQPGARFPMIFKDGG